jgi:hypothetical protein
MQQHGRAAGHGRSAALRAASEFISISHSLHRRFTPVPQSVRQEDRNDFTRATN